MSKNKNCLHIKNAHVQWQQHAGSSEDCQEEKVSSWVTVTSTQQGEKDLMELMELINDSRAIHSFQSQSHDKQHRTDSAFLHQCISFPDNHWKVKKPCQLHSWNGNTNSCYQGVGDTTEWIIYFPNGYPHAINNENLCINSPTGHMNSNLSMEVVEVNWVV